MLKPSNLLLYIQMNKFLCVGCVDIIVTKHGLVNMDLGLHKLLNSTHFLIQSLHTVCFREILSRDPENGKAMLEVC